MRKKKKRETDRYFRLFRMVTFSHRAHCLKKKLCLFQQPISVKKNVLDLKVIGDADVLKAAATVVGVPYIFIYGGRIIFLWRRPC